MRLGHLTVFLLLLEAVTGLGLMFHYRPVVGFAYTDLVDLREVSAFGFVRGLHRWGAYGAVITVWLHLLRVALRGAYAPPRRRNWMIGVALMILTLLLAATGYLLPWDQQAYWGVAALSPMGEIASAPFSGGTGPEGSTLLRVYLAHCVVLPLLLASLTVYHLRRARRDDATAARGDAADEGKMVRMG